MATRTMNTNIQGWTETKWRVSSYLVHMESLPVGDMEGHAVGIFSRRGLAFFETGEVGIFQNWGTLDIMPGETSFQNCAQYTALYTFDDGSTMVLKGQATSEPGPKGLPLYKGEGEFTKGTGRFEGIKGTASFTGSGTVYSKEKGILADAYFDFTATYALLPK